MRRRSVSVRGSGVQHSHALVTSPITVSVFCLLFSCLSSAVFPSLSVPVFSLYLCLCLSLSLSVSVSLYLRVVLWSCCFVLLLCLVCGVVCGVVWCVLLCVVCCCVLCVVVCCVLLCVVCCVFVCVLRKSSGRTKIRTRREMTNRTREARVADQPRNVVSRCPPSSQTSNFTVHPSPHPSGSNSACLSAPP